MFCTIVINFLAIVKINSLNESRWTGLFTPDIFLLLLDIEILVFSLKTAWVEFNDKKTHRTAKRVNLKRVILDLICVVSIPLLIFFQILLSDPYPVRT